MKLTHKTFVAISFTVVTLILLLMAFWRGTLLASYTGFEASDTRHDVERAQYALRGVVETINDHLNDWAAWDDPYAFISTRNPKFVQDNLSDALILEHDIGVHVVVLMAPGGRIAYRTAIEPEADPPRFMRFPRSVLEHLGPGSPLTRFTEILSRRGGFVMLPEGPLMVAAQPIVRTGHKGPINGAMIWGRFLTSRKIQEIGKITNLSITLQGLRDHTLPQALQVAIRQPGPSADQEIFVQPLNEETVAGFLLVRDLYGKPAFVLRIDQPRTLYQQGLRSVNQSGALLLHIPANSATDSGQIGRPGSDLALSVLNPTPGGRFCLPPLLRPRPWQHTSVSPTGPSARACRHCG